eukprot:IDg11073t1
MTSHLSPDQEFIALLTEIHNAAVEMQTVASLNNGASSGVPEILPRSKSARLAQIPSDLLAALHNLAPKATKSACALLDVGTHVKALACDDVLAFVVCDHIALVYGFELQSSGTLLPKVTDASVRHVCDCPSYTYGTYNFCKHIVAAGLAAAVGAVAIVHVNKLTLIEELNARAAVAPTPRASSKS